MSVWTELLKKGEFTAICSCGRYVYWPKIANLEGGAWGRLSAAMIRYAEFTDELCPVFCAICGDKLKKCGAIDSPYRSVEEEERIARRAEECLEHYNKYKHKPKWQGLNGA